MESNISGEATTIAFRGERRPPILWHLMPRILAVAASVVRIPVEFARSSNRDRRAVYARHLAMHVAYNEFGMSTPTIAYRMGKRDHTTIVHGLKKVNEYRSSHTECAAQLEEISAILAGRVPQPPAVPMDESWGLGERPRVICAITKKPKRVRLRYKVAKPKIVVGPMSPEDAIRAANEKLCDLLRRNHPEKEDCNFLLRSHG